MNLSKHQQIINFLMIILGNVLLAIAVCCFVLPNEILTGGVAGMAVALKPLIPISSVLMINILTIGLFVVGAFTLGKDFAMKTILSSLLYPTLVSILTYIINHVGAGEFIMDPLLASIYAGVFMGAGLGIVFRTGASTGGMDIPALIMTKYLHIPSGTSVAIVDGLTVLLGIYNYGLVAALVGLISVFVGSKTINKVIKINSEPALEVQIISNANDEIKDYILNEFDRGATILEARGGYTNEPRPVLMCIISRKQYGRLQQMIHKYDPKAFFIVKDVDQVNGEGWHSQNYLQ